MSDKKFKILFPTDGYVLKNYDILKDILKSVSEYVKFKATIKIDRFFNDCYVFDPIKKVIYKNKDLKVKSTFFGQSCTICNNYLIALSFKNNKNKINGIHIYDMKKYKWIFG